MTLPALYKVLAAQYYTSSNKQHNIKEKVPRNLKAYLPVISYETLIKSCVDYE